MKKLVDYLIERLIFFCGIISILIVFLIFLFLLKESIPAFSTISFKSFIFGSDWYPISHPPSFGILPLILGSAVVTLGAVIIALPLGVAAAIFISEVAPSWSRNILKSTVELLAAFPSIVLGFIGIIVLAPIIKKIFGLPSGLTALAGSILLAFASLPTIVSIIEDALNSVPRSYREGSIALGATHWQTISRVIVPAASSGIFAAVMLGIGRAIGETMTVLMVTGNAARIPTSILQPVRTLTATIAAEMGEVIQGSSHYHVLFAIGIVLFLITFIVNLSADLFLHREIK